MENKNLYELIKPHVTHKRECSFLVETGDVGEIHCICNIQYRRINLVRAITEFYNKE